MRVEKGKLYWTNDRTIVKVINIFDQPWGIHGKILSGKYAGLKDEWTDDVYPYRVSFDPDKDGLALTDEEVSKDEHPEYYL